PQHGATPVLVMAPEASELAFATAFAFGADDVVPLGQARPLILRLRALPRQKPALPTGGRGTALIADPDRARRAMLGRVLRNAGYAVTFATSANDTSEFACADGVVLVVLNTELDGAPRDVIERARTGGSTATWIVTAPPRLL